MKNLIFLLRKILFAVIFLAALCVLATIIINTAMVAATENYVYTELGDIPPKKAVMVLGAQIRGKTLSPILRDRVNGGIAALRAGKGEKLLLSGDHGERYYDEVNAMRLYVIDNAPEIPAENIFLDHAGFSTWDSMYRARDVFEVDELLIVTQRFHISRAVCMARSLGINAVGYGLADEQYGSLAALNIREYFARVKALFSMVFNIQPAYLGEKIPITGDGRDSWL